MSDRVLNWAMCFFSWSYAMNNSAEGDIAFAAIGVVTTIIFAHWGLYGGPFGNKV